jgi:hypothetical protein
VHEDDRVDVLRRPGVPLHAPAGLLGRTRGGVIAFDPSKHQH